MSSLVKNMACSNTHSFGGLLVIFGIRTLLQYAFESEHHPRPLLKVQTGLPAGLNLYHNLPTGIPQGQSGDVHKAVARRDGGSRFCVFRFSLPHSRGRPRAPS